MDASADRPEFAPPPQPGQLRAFALAIAAHLLLVAALTHGLHWQREAQNAAVEAELWAPVAQEAAPKPVVQPPPPPPPPPQPVVKPPPPPPPAVKAPEPPVQRDAQIAIEREKQKRELEKERKAELERERKAELEREHRKELALKKKEEELAKKKELQKQQLAEAKHKEDEKKRKQQEQEARETAKLAKLREENMKRMQGMAGTGGPTSQGTAAQSSGPSASWAGRVVARVRPNIVFTDAISGNPKAEVEVRTSPDGTIIGKRLVHSSGVKAWDDAVLRALDKTEVLPRDIDGRVPSPVILDFKPHG